MSRKGNCWDNAVVESSFNSLKKKRVKKLIYRTRALAEADVADYIDTFYNRSRRHSHWTVSALSNSRRLTSRPDRVSTESWNCIIRVVRPRRRPRDRRFAEWRSTWLTVRKVAMS
jgi:hypothetical protein